jgi:hypothetical protein
MLNARVGWLALVAAAFSATPACGGTTGGNQSATGIGGNSATGGSGAGGVQGNAATGCHSDSDCPRPGPSNVPWICFPAYAVYRATCGPTPPGGRPCSDDADCGPGQVCQENATVADGGLDAGGQVCVQAMACGQDAECTAGRVCRGGDIFAPAVDQNPTNFVCRAPCTTDPDCVPTDRCDSAGHCQPRTCAECPSYFSCTTGTCAVPSCSADEECPGGFCVKGYCAGSLGVCVLQCF